MNNIMYDYVHEFVFIYDCVNTAIVFMEYLWRIISDCLCVIIYTCEVLICNFFFPDAWLCK